MAQSRSKTTARTAASKAAAADSEAPAAEEYVAPQTFLTHPVVLRRKKRKKRRKKRYTRGTKAFQRFSYGLSKGAFRAVNSFSEGLDTFNKKSNKSRRRKRDGMVRDVLRNASAGFSDGVVELGKAPNEVAKRIGTRRVWRTIRVFTPPFPFGN